MKRRTQSRELNAILDEVFAIARSEGLNNAEIARRSGLAPSTVWRLHEYLADYPRFQTVVRLARVVGMVLILTRGRVERRKAG